MNKSKPIKKPTLLQLLFWAIIVTSLGGSLYVFLKAPDEHPPIIYTEPVSSFPETGESFHAAPPLLDHAPPALPKVAIIIDDIGYQNKLGEDIIALDVNLSFSILPHSPHAATLAEKISNAGRDMLLHLPLEPTEPKWNPGPGALMLSMSSNTLTNKFNTNLAGFDFIGTNHHMGSKFTTDPQAMRTVLLAVRNKGLFYVDSLTNAMSVGYATAKALGIKTAKRDIFLDNEQTSQAIQGQLVKLIAIAKKRGNAIAIGHPYPATLKALTAFQDKLLAEVELVGIHELVK